jgi:surfeit locus 1 family protein
MNARSWLVLVVSLAAAALTARLGLWQLDRAAQKLALQAAIEASAAQPALGTADVDAATPLHSRVALRGHWLPARSIWLDNRPMDGRVGFFLVTPLQLSGRPEAILVQRGWVPRNQADRTRLLPVPTPATEVEVRGRLAATPSRLFDLGESAGGPIRQNLDPAAFAVESGLRLLPLTVVQTEADTPEDSLLRHWPAPDLGLQKHYGYAFQWFALCALILGLYVWFQLIRPRLRKP